MTPVSRREFFALEAGEYLERLALLLGQPDPPDGESLVRYARALRGSASLAGPPGYAALAGALETVVKALRDGALTWSVPLGERLREAVEAGKSLLRRLREWADDDTARCERAARELTAPLGLDRPSGAAPRKAATQSAAVRGYVAREAAALAPTLERAAMAVERFEPGPLVGVGERLQPLRGLGSLPGLSPLPELLEALEHSFAAGGPGGAWPRHAGRAFRAAGAALARMARDIAASGSPEPGAPELVQVAELLAQAFAEEADVVPIEALFAAGDTRPIQRLGAPPPSAPIPAAADAAVELLSLADRWRGAAAQLREASSGPARGLLRYSLACSVHGLALSSGLRAAAGGFLRRLEQQAAAPGADTDRLAELLQQAAAAFTAAGEQGIAALGARLAPLAEALDQLDVVPIESLAPAAEPDVVPIESLAPEQPAPVVPIESLGYEAPAYTAFEQSFTTYFRLIEEEAVPIESLVYRGRRALERADVVRRQLDLALRERKQLAELSGLLGELFDLVPLALADER